MKQTTMAEFIESTNFDALRTQKTALINAQAALNAIEGKDASEVYNLTDDEEKDEFEKELDNDELEKAIDKCRGENF
jgi:hypothetical protein